MSQNQCVPFDFCSGGVTTSIFRRSGCVIFGNSLRNAAVAYGQSGRGNDAIPSAPSVRRASNRRRARKCTRFSYDVSCSRICHASKHTDRLARLSVLLDALRSELAVVLRKAAAPYFPEADKIGKLILVRTNGRVIWPYSGLHVGLKVWCTYNVGPQRSGGKKHKCKRRLSLPIFFDRGHPACLVFIARRQL